MATVQERARLMSLTLNPAALSPARRAELPTSKQFRATHIWCNIIVALQSEVEVKRRRHHLKHHNDCFLGSDAVDLILSHLLQNCYFGEVQISRSKVVRLCQALMDNKVFEPVGTKLFSKDKECAFEDSCSLYRFTTVHRWVDVVNECQASGHGFNGLHRRHEPDHFSTANHPPDSPLEELLSNLNLKPVAASSIGTSQLPHQVVEEIWQEQAILRLLQLIDLPILDSLLDRKEHQTKLQSSSTKANDITRNFLDREILKAFSDSQEDDWLSSAVDLLEFLPDLSVVEISRNLPEPSSDIDQCKVVFFDAIAKYYSQTKEPLLTNDFFDIHTGVAELLVNGKSEPALEATQLCLKLMDSRNREELRRLLNFMAVAAQPTSVTLQKGVEGRIVMKRTFGKAIVSNKNLPKGKADLLVLFLLDHQKDVFKVPGSLHKMVSEKLMFVQHGGDPDLHTGHTYCERLTRAACERNMWKTTREELLLLLQTIDENPKLSAKEKKKVLAQFNKSHPAIFIQYFFNVLRKS
ncbi:DEP domain-containing protein 7 isoform X1 [Chiloscyllium plagiosum]|uniref:DEP domain-containing protein 7 isoform X1 n=1 Tax=Chiloscyllium plagiosum TaxID=36176 RepID=UPI001CB7B78C|nr:DEP domain-containing protein 7 isoform X1 [Chiloscyllium plagiosum]